MRARAVASYKTVYSSFPACYKTAVQFSPGGGIGLGSFVRTFLFPVCPYFSLITVMDSFRFFSHTNVIKPYRAPTLSEIKFQPRVGIVFIYSYGEVIDFFLLVNGKSLISISRIRRMVLVDPDSNLPAPPGPGSKRHGIGFSFRQRYRLCHLHLPVVFSGTVHIDPERALVSREFRCGGLRDR